MVSDEEYDAALAIEIWCDDRIQEGKFSTDDFTLEDNIQYIKLLMEYEKCCYSSLSLAHSGTSQDEIMLNRTIRLVKMMSEKIMNKFC